MLFSLFSRQYLGLKTIKIETILTIFYVYYDCSFPQNLNLWLLEKSEIRNLQLNVDSQKNTFHVLSSSSPFEKHRHARRARVIFCEQKGFGDSRIKSMTCKMFY